MGGLASEPPELTVFLFFMLSVTSASRVFNRSFAPTVALRCSPPNGIHLISSILLAELTRIETRSTWKWVAESILEMVIQQSSPTRSSGVSGVIC